MVSRGHAETIVLAKHLRSLSAISSRLSCRAATLPKGASTYAGGACVIILLNLPC